MDPISPNFNQKFQETTHASEVSQETSSPKSKQSHKEMVDAEIRHLLKWAFENTQKTSL
jgi:hypothetical protein